MRSTDIIANAPWLFLVSGAFALSGWLALYWSMLISARAKHHSDRAARNAAFVEWARWATLTITTRGGTIYTRTLYELPDEPSMLVWKAPIAISLLHGAPEEEEHTGGRPDAGPGYRTEGPVSDHGPQASGHPRPGAESPDEPAGEALRG